MEEVDYMKINTFFAKSIIGSILKKIIFKKTGINIEELRIHTLEISSASSSDSIGARIDISGVIKKGDIAKLIKEENNENN